MGTGGDRGVVRLVGVDGEIHTILDQTFRNEGHVVRAHACWESFAESGIGGEAGCLVVDIDAREIPKEILALLAQGADCGVPGIVIATRPSPADVVSVLKAGASDLLLKPFGNAALVNAINNAMAKGLAQRSRQMRLGRMRTCYASLTPREQEVAHLVGAGHRNKEITEALEISARTVKVYRAKALVKMAARGVPDLVRALGMLRADHESIV